MQEWSPIRRVARVCGSVPVRVPVRVSARMCANAQHTMEDPEPIPVENELFAQPDGAPSPAPGLVPHHRTAQPNELSAGRLTLPIIRTCWVLFDATTPLS